MVRIKYRYLLLQILYPSPSPSNPSHPPRPGNDNPPTLLTFHHPTPDTLTPALLARCIKDGVGELYGDYGVGLVGASLSGSLPRYDLRV